MELATSLLIGVFLIAFLCQYVSVAIGMGYGTILTPLLLVLGFSPLQVVPAVLLSQLVGGTIGGLAHHRVGNINLDFKKDDKLVKERLRGLGYLPRSDDSKVVLVLAGCGVAGVLVGVFTAVNIPAIVLQTYIGLMVLGIGLAVLLLRRGRGVFSWRGLIVLGLLSAFNKGVSGGGYVPLVTGGQIISGRGVKSSVGSTTVAVAIVCAAGFLSYLLIKGDIFWTLAIVVSVGSVIAAPLAALTARKVRGEKMGLTIGLSMVTLGALLLLRTLIF